MKSLLLSVLLLIGGAALQPAIRAAEPTAAPVRYYISIYHVAPGKHLDFLKWMAADEALALEAGFPPTQWFSHVDGDSWDFLAISQSNASSQAEERLKQLKKERGLPEGVAASVAFKQFIASHTDTFALGPFTARQLEAAAEGRK